MRKRPSKQVPAPPVAEILPPQTKEERIKNELFSVESRILSELESNVLSIASQKVAYLSQKEKKTKEEQAYNKIQREKKKMEEKLQILKNTERQYADKVSPKSKSQLAKTAQPELTEEQKEKIKKLKRQLRKFEESLQKKTIEFERNKEKQILEKQEQLQKERQAKNQIKRAIIAKNLQEIKLKNQQRQKKFKEESLLLKKIEKKKKMHEMLDENWREKLDQEEQRKYEIMQKRIKDKHIDFVNLREHEKKYEEIISQKKKQLNKRRLDLSQISNNSTMSYTKSKYYTMVVKDERMMKLQQIRKNKQRAKLRKKVQDYVTYVKEEHAPRAKSHEDEEKEQKVENQIIRMTKEEIKELGDINLRLGNSKIKRKQDSDESSIKVETFRSEKKNYPDYLSEVRKKKDKEHYYDGFHNSPKYEAAKIMKDEKIKQEDKVAKLKLLAERFDSQTSDMVTKIMGKIQILEMIN